MEAFWASEMIIIIYQASSMDIHVFFAHAFFVILQSYLGARESAMRIPPGDEENLNVKNLDS